MLDEGDLLDLVLEFVLTALEAVKGLLYLEQDRFARLLLGLVETLEVLQLVGLVALEAARTHIVAQALLAE